MKYIYRDPHKRLQAHCVRIHPGAHRSGNRQNVCITQWSWFLLDQVWEGETSPLCSGCVGNCGHSASWRPGLLCRRTPRVRWEQSRGISIATGFCCDEACCSCVLRVSSVQIHGAATAHALYSQYTYTKHIGWHSTAQYTCTCTVLIIVTGRLKQEMSNARTLITVNNGWHDTKFTPSCW